MFTANVHRPTDRQTDRPTDKRDSYIAPIYYLSGGIITNMYLFTLFYRFGKTKVDEFSILAPLIQCCVVRHSTVLKLLKLYIGPERLSTLLDKSTKSDPIYPILTDAHLNAVDRRVMHILRAVALCVEKTDNIDQVMIEDGL